MPAAVTGIGRDLSRRNEAALRQAITDANGDGDPDATIVLTSSFTVSTTVLPTFTKPMAIDTQAFTLSNPRFGAGTNMVTFSGTFVGTDAAPAPSTAVGSDGVIFGNLSVRSSIANNSSIKGGMGGGGGGVGGAGITLTNTSFTNNGTITGGNGVGTASGGAGVRLARVSALTNNGTIQGGDVSGTGSGGVGVEIGHPTGGNDLTNNGIIRGGSGPNNGINLLGGVAIYVRSGTDLITNNNLVEGGIGALAIGTNSTTVDLNLINSGTIRAGVGQANAIALFTGATTGNITLELQAGSVIEGNVLANATATGDIFRLGGAANDIFDVSAIGPQYQNFDTYEKTGTSTWALTGAGTATTNWNIQDGTLQLGNGGTSGSVIGNLTTASTGTLAFNRSDTFSFNNLVLGNGTISQVGTGTTIMTADNSAFAGSTTIKAGTLSVNGILGGR